MKEVQATAKVKNPDKPSPETTELHMYYAWLLEESGKPADALKHLAAREKYIIDKEAMAAMRARLHLALGDADAAKAQYEALLKTNSENVDYHVGLLGTMGIWDK